MSCIQITVSYHVKKSSAIIFGQPVIEFGISWMVVKQVVVLQTLFKTEKKQKKTQLIPC